MASNNRITNAEEIQGSNEAGAADGGLTLGSSTGEPDPPEHHFHGSATAADKPSRTRTASNEAAPPDAASKEAYVPDLCIVQIDQIRIGASFREDPTVEQESLRSSVGRSGLLHLPVINQRFQLVAGRRRLLALQALGYKSTTVLMLPVSGKDLLLAHRDENTERVKLTVDEALKLAEAIEPTIKAEAREQRRRGAKGSGASSHASRRWKRTRDKVAAATGKSDRTLRKAKAVKASGRKDLNETMRRTGKVDGVYKELMCASPNKRIRMLEGEAKRLMRQLESLAAEVEGKPDLEPDRRVALAKILEGIGRLARRIYPRPKLQAARSPLC